MLPLLVVAAAQDKPTFSVDVKVVNVLATVRDAKGALINSLGKDDFVLEVGGQPQEIRYFSRQTDQPLVMGLLVDTSGSQRRLIDEERYASSLFVDQVMREEDRAFLIKFDFEAELLQDLTGSREMIKRGLDQLEAPPMMRNRILPNWQFPRGGGMGRRGPGWPGGGTGWPGGRDERRGRVPPLGSSMRGGTKLYDAVFLAADEVLKPQAGRKAIILISDGVDQGSKLGIDRAIEACQRADTIVYAIRYAENDNGKAPLDQMAEETGGRSFDVTAKQPLERIFAQIQDELRNQYSIGFTAPEDAGEGFRTIKLRTRNPKDKVAARAGYYPKPS